MQQILYGIDVFLQQAAVYKNKRIGFVTNDAAVSTSGILSRLALVQNGFTIVKLFSPEHGIGRSGDDGVAQQNHTDIITRLPVISLYGTKLAPTEEDLQDIDVVVFDIPGVGCRFYTYLWTMTHIMEACAQYNKPLIILDRPNPTGALLKNAEGPFLDEKHCASFIGRWNIPVTHCCTLGELALYFRAQKMPQLNIEIIKVKYYRRNHTAWQDFKFVPTSPAIQNIETAALYPGMGLLEGININEGRGTATPFTICGAPWINSEKLLLHFQQKQIPGIKAITVSYTPNNSLYAGELCNGLAFEITNAAILRPVLTGIQLLQILFKLYPQHITERLYHTAANPAGSNHLDKLLGVYNSFDILKNGGEIETAISEKWEMMIAAYLLY
jgi:uncharacterized protein YbbC (DUF1343 family)